MFPQPNTTTFDTQYLVQGLLPFLDYSAYIYAYNKYTVAGVYNYYLPDYGGIVLNPPSGLTCVTKTKEGGKHWEGHWTFIFNAC